MAMGIAEQQGLLDGMSDADLAKMEAQLQKMAEAFVREQDQEVSAAEAAYNKQASEAVRSYSKIMKERKAAAKKEREEDEGRKSDAGQQALQLVRGGALIVAANQEQTESFVRLAVAIQGYYDVVKSGVGLAKTVSAASAASTAANAAGAAATTAAAGAATAGASGAAAGGGVAAGLAGIVALINPFTIAIVAATAALYAYSVYLKEQRDLAIDRAAEKSDLTRVRSQGIMQRLNLQTRHGIEDNETYNEIAKRSTERFSAAYGRRSRQSHEQQLRAGEQNIDDTTVGQRSIVRDRSASEEQYQVQQSRLQNQERYSRSHLSNLKLEQERLNDPAMKRTITQTHLDRQKAITDQRQAILDNPEGSWLFRQSDGKRQLTQQQLDKEGDLATQSKGVEKDEAAAIAKLERDRLENAKAIAREEQNITKNLEEQHKAAVTLEQSAYNRLQTEREKNRSGKIAFGSMDLGEQAIQIEIQRKHDRIEAKKAENRAKGIDENTDVEEYNQFELQGALRGGGIAGKSAEAQILKNSKNSGFTARESNDETEAAAQKDFDAKKEETAKLTKELEGKIEVSTSKNEEIADRIVKSLEKVFDLEMLAAKIDEAVNRAIAKNEHSKFRGNTYSGER
jgi:hypothetical protein